MKKLKLTFACTVVAVLLAACTKKSEQTDLYFGMNTPGSGHVTTEEWKNFSEQVIARHFPLGSTEWDARGRYFNPETRETITENTKVVTVVGDKNAERDAAIQQVVDEYRKRFKQQAVFRVDADVEAQLVTGK